MKRRITDIQVQKNRPSRLSLFLDGKFFCGISTETSSKFHLECGMEIEEDTLKSLIYEEELSKAKSYVYDLLALRMYTSKEIKEKLRKRGYSDEIIQDIVSTMERYGYLNDRAFAEEWIQSRMQTKPKGRIVLQRELAQKGIEESIIEESLNQKFDESGESDTVLDIARRRIKSYKNDDPIATKRKLYSFLLRRGFNFEIVKNAVEKVMEERESN